MSREHTLCSPSSLKRRDLCSASCFEESGLESSEDENSRRGTRLHKLMEYLLKGRIHKDRIPKDEWEAISKAKEMAELALGDELLPDGTTANGGIWYAEVLLWSKTTAASGYTDKGTCDLLVVYEREKRAVVLDWKFGGALIDHPKWNPQLQCYVADAWDYLAEKYGRSAFEFTIETTYIQPAAVDGYDLNPWSFGPEDRSRLAAKIREIRERAYGENRSYVVGPACDQCEAAKRGTCWARKQVFAGLVGIAGLSSMDSLTPEALGRAIDAIDVSCKESERLWTMAKDAMRSGMLADGWKVSSAANRIYRTLSERSRISEPNHLRIK